VRSIIALISIIVLVFAMTGLASGQARQDQAKKDQPSSDKPANNGTSEPQDKKPEEQSIFIHLVGGGKLEVEEARETNDGIWYKRGGLTTLLDRSRVARIEKPSLPGTKSAPVDSQSPLRWTLADSAKVERFFLTKFGRPLPTSSFGQSDIHNRWGLDHRQGMDIGLHPDSAEGLALANFLRSERIPFMVFRGAIPGVATGPHIHVGFASHRYLPR
jgi:hypothetical protein